MSTGKSAVLFFSRTLNDEYASNTFGLGYHRFSSLYKFLVNKTLSTVKDSGLPVAEVYSDRQVGHSFGERLVNSLREVAKDGFTSVIIVGNDAPELTTEDILSAESMLKRQVNVLGRDKRGGTYLIGLNLKHFDLSRLQDIAWHSKDVCDQLEQLLGDIHDLSVKRDINTSQDLYQLLRRGHGLTKRVYHFLRSLTLGVRRTKQVLLSIKDFFYSAYLDRGPPAFIR